ncbi:MAG TPA: NAD-binding protein, partial [Anaerolineales bacterium]|nr:NAD-binding protein [Anaerolineales bacterium]
ESGNVAAPVPWQLVIARMLLPLVTGYAAILTLAALFRDQMQQLSLRFARNHVVICGLGRMGLLLAGECNRTGRRVVVIEIDPANPHLEPARRAGAAVIVGDAANPEHLRSAGVARAGFLVVLCGQDAVNAEVAIRARDLTRARSAGALTCILQIGDPTLGELLRSHTFALDEASGFRLEILNLYDTAVRAMLKAFPALLGANRARSPHILIVGGGGLGVSLILQASLAWRSLGLGERNRLRVSLVDAEAERRLKDLASRYPWLDQLCILRPFEVDILGAEFREDHELNQSILAKEATGICVCLDDDAHSLSAGLMLSDRLRGREIPIIMGMSDDRGLARLLPAWDPTGAERSGLQAFPLLENACQLDLVLGGIHELLARAIHDNYVKTQTELGETPATNPSLVGWGELSESLREANRAQSRHIGAKLRSIGCTIAPLADLDADAFQFNPQELEFLAEAEHQRWMEATRKRGYRFAPGPKDAERKTHPSLIPWSDLSEGEKEKDRAATRAIPGLLALAGLQIYRVPAAGPASSIQAARPSG